MFGTFALKNVSVGLIDLSSQKLSFMFLKIDILIAWFGSLWKVSFSQMQNNNQN